MKQHSSTAKPARECGEPVQKRVVLLVDDDADWRMLVRDALAQSDVAQEMPLEVYEAEDGHVALRFLMREGEFAHAPQPNLMYLDCEMPRVDGITVLTAVRSDPRLRDVPAIMLTGITDEACMRRASEGGAVAYIIKPARLEDLRRAIDASAGYWLRSARSENGGNLLRAKTTMERAA